MSDTATPRSFAITVFIALRIAFSTVNDALGTGPDAAFRSTAPEAVLDAVTFGRPIDEETSGVRHPTATANPWVPRRCSRRPAT